MHSTLRLSAGSSFKVPRTFRVCVCVYTKMNLIHHRLTHPLPSSKSWPTREPLPHPFFPFVLFLFLFFSGEKNQLPFSVCYLVSSTLRSPLSFFLLLLSRLLFIQRAKWLLFKWLLKTECGNFLN